MNPSSSTIPVKIQIGCLLILVFLPILLYFNSLKGSFQFDDRDLIQQSWISSLEAYEKSVHVESFGNRPVLLFTYALNNTLHKNQVFGFHLLNLQLHLLVSVLIFIIIARSQRLLTLSPTGQVRKDSERNHLLFPLAAALLFASHPLNTDSVSYISSRSTLLASFFYLLTLLLFIELFFPRRSRFGKAFQAMFVLLLMGSMYLAIASKLIAATLPAILFVWFLVFVCPGQYPGFRSAVLNKKMVSVCAAAGACLLAVLLFPGSGFLYSPLDQGIELFGRIPYFLLQAKVIVFYYLKLFFFPINLNVDPGFPFSSLFSDFKIPLSILMIAGVLILVFKYGGAWPATGAAWFFITLSPTSSIIPLNDLAVEHRTYLPISLGLCLVSGWWLCRWRPKWRTPALILVLAVCGALTIDRNKVWTSEISLWSDSIKKNPHSSRIHNNIGKAYYENRQLKPALFHLQKSVEIIPRHVSRQYNVSDPVKFLQRLSERKDHATSSAGLQNGDLMIKSNLVEPHYNLASVYLDLDRLDEAEREYQTAIRLKPDHFAAYFGLGSVHTLKQQYDPAAENYRQAIEKRRKVTGEADYPLARLNLGQLYGRKGQYAEAVGELKLAVRHDPSLGLAHYNLGTAYLMLNKLDNAEHSFKTCLQLNANFEPASFNLAKVYQQKKDWSKSTRQFERFLEAKGPDANAYFEIGRNFEQQRRLDDAVKYYRMALVSNPPPGRIQLLEQLIGDLSAP